MAALAEKIDHKANGDAPRIVVFGCETKGKPRGSWFAATDVAQAMEAAALMGLDALVVNSPDIDALARRVPKGRFFTSGKVFTPLIQGKVYEQLLEHVPVDQRAPKLTIVAGGKTSDGEKTDDKASSQAGDVEPPVTVPEDWSKIGMGSLVLAEEAEGAGWYEAIVVELRPNDLFSLKWRDYPEEPTIVRHRTRLALMHPRPSGA